METNFGKILENLMQEQGYNQLQLAALLGVRQSQVSNWINGKSLPGYYSIRMISVKMNVSSDFILELVKNK
ncbi:MAG: helix-turn-helix domain-containing protein [Firmicutes bacterium]|nr:helix-turn-helix domain-containing protein [Bacillota bacterium]